MDASSVHSESWVVLSHRDDAHSHCGSSPRSLSASDTYDSDSEGVAARRCATAAALLAALPVPGAPAARAEDELVPFGSLVLDGRESPLAAAVAADGSAPPPPIAAPPARAGSGSGSLIGSPRMLGPGSVPPSVTSSPRSSYEHPSSHASHHDLYSLSQVGLRVFGGVQSSSAVIVGARQAHTWCAGCARKCICSMHIGVICSSPRRRRCSAAAWMSFLPWRCMLDARASLHLRRTTTHLTMTPTSTR